VQIQIQPQISILPKSNSYPSSTPILKEHSKSSHLRSLLSASIVALIKEQVVVVGACSAMEGVDVVDEESRVTI
jgi:hypothetical protein